MFIAPGFTFTDNTQDQGSASAFQSFMASANVTSIALADLRASAHAVQTSATTPASNQGAGSLWFDSTLNIFRQLDSTRWDCPYQGAGMTNNTGATIPQGAWVVASADNAISMCASNLLGEIAGVMTAAVLNGAVGVVQRTGIVQARCAGPLSYGDVLVSAVAFGGNGYAKGATTVFGFTNFTGGLEIGMALGTLGNTTGLVTCMAWR
jgi:hypothetical protein